MGKSKFIEKWSPRGNVINLLDFNGLQQLFGFDYTIEVLTHLCAYLKSNPNPQLLTLETEETVIYVSVPDSETIIEWFYSAVNGIIHIKYSKSFS